jgi:hypothetical protein
MHEELSAERHQLAEVEAGLRREAEQSRQLFDLHIKKQVASLNNEWQSKLEVNGEVLREKMEANTGRIESRVKEHFERMESTLGDLRYELTSVITKVVRVESAMDAYKADLMKELADLVATTITMLGVRPSG